MPGEGSGEARLVSARQNETKHASDLVLAARLQTIVSKQNSARSRDCCKVARGAAIDRLPLTNTADLKEKFDLGANAQAAQPVVRGCGGLLDSS